MSAYGGLKILVIGGRRPPEPFLERLFRGLADRGERLWLAGTADPGLDHEAVRGLVPPSRGRLADWRRRLGLDTPDRDTDFYLQAGFDLVYFPWNSPAVEHLDLMRAMPSLVSCRGSQILIAPHQPGREALAASFPPMFEAATAVHCVSRDILQASLELGLAEDKARVITPAVDGAFFCPSAAPRDPSTLEILSVGALLWRKGFEDALVAMGRLRDQGVAFCYHLVGGGPDLQRLRFTVSDLELEGRVHLHGPKAPHEVRDLMQRCHVFLLSSVCEGIANVVLEAMACGMAVVSTRCGGMEEAVEDGVEGLLVPARDPEAMADAVATLQDVELRRKLGRAGRRRVERDFRLEDQVEAFQSLCHDVASRRITKTR